MNRVDQRYRTLIAADAQVEGQDWLQKLRNTRKIDIIGLVQDAAQASELARAQRPDVLIVHREAPLAEAIIRQVMAVVPSILCVAMVPDPDVPSLRRLMAVGARDVLPTSASYSELIASIREIITAEAERRNTDGLASQSQLGRGKLIVVVAPKGGVGATTVATNVAVALRETTAQPVALADFSLQFGDVGVHLNLRSRYTINDLIATAAELEDTMLNQVMSSHNSGVDVLLAPPEPELAAEVSGEAITSILAHMLNRYAYVVVDTWTFLDEITTTLLRQADEVLLVATPELPTLKNAKRFLEVVGRQNLVEGRVSIVLNRFPSVEGISLEDVQQHLGHHVSANIPSEGQMVTHSINRGVPLVVSHPKSWASQNITRLASKLAGNEIDTISLTKDGDRAGDMKSRTGGWRWKLSRNTAS